MPEDIKQQIKEFDEMIKKYPFIQELYIGRAVLYARIGEYEKAVKDYETAHEDYIYDIIAVCRRNHLSREIERLYTNKINKDKNDIANYISRARFYMTIYENEKALADCETVLKICPNNKFILRIKKSLIKEMKERNKSPQKAKSPKIFLT